MSSFNAQSSKGLLADDRASVGVGDKSGSDEAKDSGIESHSQKTKKSCCAPVSRCCVFFYDAFFKGNATGEPAAPFQCYYS